MLFTDGSVHTQTKLGYGAYLSVTPSEAQVSLATIKEQVKVKRFENTSSTKLELQTLLWALDDIKPNGAKIILYTDSQNIIGLPRRRERFERTDYFSKNNKKLNNFELYQAFFEKVDSLNIELVKVKGHKASGQKDEIDQLFTLVDKASRTAQRENAC